MATIDLLLEWTAATTGAGYLFLVAKKRTNGPGYPVESVPSSTYLFFIVPIYPHSPFYPWHMSY